jgi:GNAT superfamily N-acetyltransferase
MLVLNKKQEQALNQLKAQIKEFCETEDNFGNEWFSTSFVKIYIRKGFRAIDKNFYSSIDIASIEVSEKYHGQGIGTKLIQEIHNFNPRSLTYVECVHNPHLKDWLQRNGWQVNPVLFTDLYKFSGNSRDFKDSNNQINN